MKTNTNTWKQTQTQGGWIGYLPDDDPKKQQIINAMSDYFLSSLTTDRTLNVDAPDASLNGKIRIENWELRIEKWKMRIRRKLT